MSQNPYTEKVQVLGIAGSLRKGSYNRALLRAAKELAPDEMEIQIFDNETLTMIPPYNEDVREMGEPETVEILKQEIKHADALLFAIPEYNYSISGVLKNALDWASRPPGGSPLNEKPVALMGASVGSSGTMRAQIHFRQLCVSTNMFPLNNPKVFVTHSAGKFDSGKLVDEDTRNHVRRLAEGLLKWTRKLHYGSTMMEIRNKAMHVKETAEAG